MFLKVNELTMHVQIDGPAEAPPLVLLHSLGTSLHVWDATARGLARRYRVIRPDLRGHGLTSVTPGPYSAAQMADDVLTALDCLGEGPVLLGGLSIGGLIAQAIAAMAPARVRALMLADTAMILPPPALWRERAALAREQGMAPLIEPVLARWVTADFLGTPQAHGLRAMLRRTDPQGYAGAAEALADADLRAPTATLRQPTLIMVGEHDLATPLAAAQALQAAIVGSEFVVLPGAAHIPTVQTPDAVTGAIHGFLAGLALDPWR